MNQEAPVLNIEDVPEVHELNLENIPTGTLSLQDLIDIAMNNDRLPPGFGSHLNSVIAPENQNHARRGEPPSLVRSTMVVSFHSQIK